MRARARSWARPSILGPRAASTRASAGKGTGAPSSMSRKSTIFEYQASVSRPGWPWSMSGAWLTPKPSVRRCCHASRHDARRPATSTGSCIHTLRMPVATPIPGVAQQEFDRPEDVAPDIGIQMARGTRALRARPPPRRSPPGRRSASALTRCRCHQVASGAHSLPEPTRSYVRSSRGHPGHSDVVSIRAIVCSMNERVVS